MLYRALFAIFSLSFASSAFACVIYPDAPSDKDFQALQNLDSHITNETNLKSKIDASVWGVFLDRPSQGIYQNGYARFKVGDIFKGHTDEIIHIVSKLRDVTLNTEVHHLNLRQIDKGRWTDVGVTQKKLNWGMEACKISTNSQRCKTHMAEQEPFEQLCKAFISQVYIGCLNRQSLPINCLQYEAALVESWGPVP